jgi:late competence protein required for DNA uptake (superfamily II DNA/RNA helicase)
VHVVCWDEEMSCERLLNVCRVRVGKCLRIREEALACWRFWIEDDLAKMVKRNKLDGRVLRWLSRRLNANSNMLLVGCPSVLLRLLHLRV